MAKHKCAIYEVFNDDGALIVRGTNQEVAEELGCDKHVVNSYARNNTRINKTYTVKIVGFETRDLELREYRMVYRKRKKEIEKPLTPDEEILKSQIWNLKHNGNTVVAKDPKKHLEIFRGEGIECEYETIRHPNEKPYYIFQKK